MVRIVHKLSYYLAAALEQSLPEAKLLEPYETAVSGGFDCLYAVPFDAATSDKVEHALRGLLRKGIPCEKKTMTRANGIAFLRDHGFRAAAQKAESMTENLITFCVIGSFCDLCPAEREELDVKGEEVAITARVVEAHYPNLGMVQVLRLEVRTFASKQARRHFLEHYEAVHKQDLVRRSEELGLLHFEEGCVFWLPRGLPLAERLQEVCEREYRAHGVVEVKSPLFEHVREAGITLFEEKLYAPTRPSHKAFQQFRAVWEWAFHDHFVPTKDLEGLFCTRGMRGDCFHIFCSEGEARAELFWALQSIRRVATLLELPILFELVECGDVKKNTLLAGVCQELGITYRVRGGKKASRASVEVVASDVLGRQWLLSSVGFMAGKSFHIEGSFLFSLERVVALLVEKGDGILPFWLSPVQVKIVPLEKGAKKWAQEVATALAREEIRVSVDESSRSLGERLYRLREEGVPCAAILGPKEVERQKIGVRYLGAEAKQYEFSLQEFIEHLQNSKER